jgi:hypothetical protein
MIRVLDSFTKKEILDIIDWLENSRVQCQLSHGFSLPTSNDQLKMKRAWNNARLYWTTRFSYYDPEKKLEMAVYFSRQDDAMHFKLVWC